MWITCLKLMTLHFLTYLKLNPGTLDKTLKLGHWAGNTSLTYIHSHIATPNRGLSTLMTNDVPFEMSGEVMWTKQQCTWVQEVAMHEDTVQHS
jgi:hypothetical protein